MRHERIQAKRMITRQLKVAERAIDDAGIAIGQLIIAGLQARTSAGLSITVGDQPIAGMIETMVGWQRMRESVIGAHHRLYELDGRLGTQPYASGDLGDKGDDAVDYPEKPIAGNVVPMVA